MNNVALTTANIPLPHWHSGKVRNTYQIPNRKQLLLMVASDRLSTHNIVHLSPVPEKGELLTALSAFWLMGPLGSISHHIVAWGRRIYKYLPQEHEYPLGLHHRAIVIHERKVTRIEFIFRNYLAGSLWRVYQKSEDPYRLRLRQGLPLMHRFSQPVFTPTEKSENDEPLPYGDVLGRAPAGVVATRRAFNIGTPYLAERGITLIDGKFEASGETLVDEWLNGDCCRMAWTKDVHEGEEPPWLDKEIARQIAMQKWGDGPKSPLEFSEHETNRIAAGYHTAFEAITNMTLSAFQKEHMD